jgi:PadR family transcriptional regulator PadR
MSPARDMRKGSTTVLILSLVAERPMYGYQIAKELERRSGGYFDFKEGTLYPALHRMENEGLLCSEWQVVAEGPSRKYYHITEKGKRALVDVAAEWTTFSHKILAILEGVQGVKSGTM